MAPTPFLNFEQTFQQAVISAISPVIVAFYFSGAEVTV
ncbi:hypothetical protein BN439_1044 [Erwinia amylovora Ea644]|nr:hypothetical protein BN439_1044 [Erwinia amylovora Ea644]